MVSPASRADTLTAWQFDPTTQQLTLTLPSGVTPRYSVEANPDRIVLVLPQTQLAAATTSQTYSGAVRQVSLRQVDGDTVVELELAADSAVTAAGVNLVAIDAGEQTRWVLTAMAGLPVPTLPQGTLDSPQMIVEMPPLPGDPALGFPTPGTGRLSTSAANLMLPSDIDSLANLPETLPVDPFNLAASGEQVSVPSLEELDAVVGPVATAPIAPAVAPPDPSTVALSAAAGGTAAGNGSILTAEPPAAASRAVAVSPGVAAPVSEPEVEPEVAIAPLPSVPPIDSETSGVPIAVTPPALPNPPVPSSAAPEPTPAPSPAAGPGSGQASPIAVAPPNLPPVAAQTAAPEVAIAPQPDAIVPNAIVQEPPAIASLPVALTGTSDPAILAVPTAPGGSVQVGNLPPTPPTSTPPLLAAAGEPILFGAPLPGADAQAAFPAAVDELPSDRPLSPDTLVAAGTLLQLQYVGDEPINLNTGSSQNHVLVLAQDIRDPITNGIVAPAGSQLIGQFESTTNGQRWVSKMLIAPAGQQVPFSSTSEYMVGSPDINTPRLAAGAGLGALALMLVTGFSGIGLIGGALVGATTVVGTSPQHIVIEPNQIVQVQVIQDVPRSIPIAAAPENSREWGSSGW
jgi:hypothetical protein